METEIYKELGTEFNLAKFLTYGGKFGAYGGIILVAFSVLIYSFNVNMFNPMFGLLSFVISFGTAIVFMIMGAKQYRVNVLGSSMNYLQALAITIVIGVICFYISAFFSYILNAWIDPAYAQEQLKKMEDYLYSMQEKSPVLTDDKIKEILDKSGESMKNPLSQLLKSMYFSPLIVIGMSLLISIFVRRKPSVIE